MRHTAEKLDSLMQRMSLSHFLQVGHHRTITTDNKLNFRICGANGGNDLDHEVDALSVGQPTNDNNANFVGVPFGRVWNELGDVDCVRNNGNVGRIECSTKNSVFLTSKAEKMGLLASLQRERSRFWFAPRVGDTDDVIGVHQYEFQKLIGMNG